MIVYITLSPWIIKAILPQSSWSEDDSEEPPKDYIVWYFYGLHWFAISALIWWGRTVLRKMRAVPVVEVWNLDEEEGGEWIERIMEGW